MKITRAMGEAALDELNGRNWGKQAAMIAYALDEMIGDDEWWSDFTDDEKDTFRCFVMAIAGVRA